MPHGRPLFSGTKQTEQKVEHWFLLLFFKNLIVFSLFIECIGLTLANKIMLVSRAQFHDPSSAHCTACSPPQLRSPSVTSYPEYCFKNCSPAPWITVVPLILGSPTCKQGEGLGFFTYSKNRCGMLAGPRASLVSGSYMVNKVHVIPDLMELKVWWGRWPLTKETDKYIVKNCMIVTEGGKPGRCMRNAGEHTSPQVAKGGL